MYPWMVVTENEQPWILTVLCVDILAYLQESRLQINFFRFTLRWLQRFSFEGNACLVEYNWHRLHQVEPIQKCSVGNFQAIPNRNCFGWTGLGYCSLCPSQRNRTKVHWFCCSKRKVSPPPCLPCVPPPFETWAKHGSDPTLPQLGLTPIDTHPNDVVMSQLQVATKLGSFKICLFGCVLSSVLGRPWGKMSLMHHWQNLTSISWCCQCISVRIWTCFYLARVIDW